MTPSLPSGSPGSRARVSTPDCCTEFAQYAAVTRRGLLAGALGVGAATSVFGSAVVTASAAALSPAPAVLVVLSMRGACDGLSLVVPHADPVYYAARPRIAIPSASLLAKDGMFGLHPALEPLLPWWNAGKMAAVHATGLPAPNRSHFAAMEEVEDADPGSAVRSGWLNRLIGQDAETSALQALNLAGGVPPASLYGDQPVMSADSVDDMRIAGDDQWDTDHGRLRSLHTLWDGNTSSIGRAMHATFEAVTAFAPVQQTPEQPQNGAAYPATDLGRALAAVARVVKGDVGVRVLTVDHGDWDMHTDIGTLEWGRMLQNAGDFAKSVAAFLTDLGPWADKVTVLTLSEFGRRVEENANYGLDHGYGNVMFLAGAGVRGGYFGTWPGLSKGLDADLLVTTDYRSVLSEVVLSRFGASPAAVFPGFVRSAVGVMQGG